MLVEEESSDDGDTHLATWQASLSMAERMGLVDAPQKPLSEGLLVRVCVVWVGCGGVHDWGASLWVVVAAERRGLG